MENQTKQCPFCGEEININAKKCKHCGEWIENNNNNNKNAAKTYINKKTNKVSYGPFSKIGLIISVIIILFFWDSLNLTIEKCLLLGLIIGIITTILDSIVSKK